MAGWYLKRISNWKNPILIIFFSIFLPGRKGQRHLIAGIKKFCWVWDILCLLFIWEGPGRFTS